MAMPKDLDITDILARLQRHRGYKGWRISPHWSKANLWIAEYYTFIGRGYKKGWRVLRDEKEQYRTFHTPQLAYRGLAKQQAEWQRELGEQDQTFEVVDMVNEKKQLGRVSPFYYRQVKYAEEAESLNEDLSDALLRDDGAIPWLLDIRYDPEISQPHGSHLKDMHPKQYRHARGLGIKERQLFYPSSAVREILKMLQEGSVFILLSDNQEHVKQVEALVREEATKQGLNLEDPYGIGAGDLCRYVAPTDSPIWEDRTPLFLQHRTPYVYRFLGYDLGENRSGYVDIRDLVVIEAGKYRCDTCGKGEKTVRWHEPASQKLCRHCFWEWDLEHEE